MCGIVYKKTRLILQNPHSFLFFIEGFFKKKKHANILEWKSISVRLLFSGRSTPGGGAWVPRHSDPWDPPPGVGKKKPDLCWFAMPTIGAATFVCCGLWALYDPVLHICTACEAPVTRWRFMGTYLPGSQKVAGTALPLGVCLFVCAGWMFSLRLNRRLN